MDTLTLITIFVLSLYTYLVYLYILYKKRRNTNTSTTSSHGFKIYPILGTLPSFLVNRHRFLEWSTTVLAGCPTNTAVFRRPGKVHGVITANPQVVEHMLKSNFDHHPKGERFITLLRDFLGTGIFNIDGELWKTQRKTASYEFNTKSLRNFVMENVTVELKTRLIPILESACRENKILDVQDILERFAFDNICKVAFNVDPGCLGSGEMNAGNHDFMQAFEDAANLSSGRFMYAIPGFYAIKKFLNVGSERKLRKAIKSVHEFADKIIRTRMEERVEKRDEDLLSRFMGNSNHNDENTVLDVTYLRDIVISFILAGRDTTSSALTWFFWLLSINPHVEENIMQELEKIRSRNGKSIGEEAYTFEELREMHYLQAAISESMRLYPPVPVNTKSCDRDHVLPDGTFIGKGWFITYTTYAMGRMENIWGKDCCEFKPERWIDENGFCKQENPFKYPVFHAGPRMCLGKDMAYIQMKSIAASILERFELDHTRRRNTIPKDMLSLTLRMKGGLPVRVKERSNIV